MEPMEIMQLIICGVISLLIIISVGSNLYKSEYTKISVLKTIFLAIITIVIIINSMFLNSVARLVTTYITILVTYRLIYKSNANKLLIGSLYALGIIIASEGLVAIFFLVIKAKILSSNLLIGNTLILITSTIVSKKINIDITGISNKIKLNSNYYIIAIVICILCMITLIVFRFKAKNFVIDYEIITNIVLVILLFIVGIIIENDRKISDGLQKKYIDLARYAKQNENLIEKYRMERHENKNQLIVIRNMVDNNNPKILEYIDNLLETKNRQINNSFISDLQYLTIPGLKGFINYKIQEMKDLGINVELVISKDVSNFKVNKFTIKEEDELYKLVGIYVDNAKDAANESEEKIVAISVYKDKNELVLEIANTYGNIISIDDPDSNMPTTKGIGHGYGLKIATSIISKSDIYSTKTEVKNGFFIQRLTISNQIK